MKVSIIGGGGLVGSMTAFALQTAGIVSDICLLDANSDMGKGQVVDLLHGSSLVADQRITFGDYPDLASSQIIVITAGLRRKPDESRLDLINRNVDLFLTILENIKPHLQQSTYLVVVSNPVDVLTYLAAKRLSLPWQRVIGLGTQLDSVRFRSYIARKLQVPATSVNAMILGEHGDSMVPIWSSASINGLTLSQWPGVNPAMMNEVFEDTKTAGAQLIKLKGGSGFAVGLSIADVVHSIAQDYRKILPVSTMQQGLYGLRDVCISVPTIVGCGGARQQLEIPLSPKEQMGLQNSARVLRQTIETVEQRLIKSPAAQTSSATTAAPSPATAAKPVAAPVTAASNGRSIPRTAWAPKS